MARALIFLFDGTGLDAAEGNQFYPTNIYQLNMLIESSRVISRRRYSQVSFYYPGIGNDRESRSQASKLVSRLFGVGILASVCRAYVNLCSNYREGDQIFLFGFSRGAVAARVLARIVSDFGVLRPGALMLTEKLMQAFENAISNPRQYKDIAENFSNSFAKEFQSDRKIEYLGLFDCVSGPNDTEIKDEFFTKIDVSVTAGVNRYLHLLSLHDIRKEFVLRRLEPTRGIGKEIWMPGTHGDIGGGHVAYFFSNLALMTMCRDAMRHGKLAFDLKEMSFLRNAVELGIRKEEFVVNAESTLVVSVQSRSVYFYPDSSEFVHAVHRKLVGRTIKWKHDDPVGYVDRIPSFWEDDGSKDLMRDFDSIWSDANL